jgi:hypothetical protein
MRQIDAIDLTGNMTRKRMWINWARSVAAHAGAHDGIIRSPNFGLNLDHIAMRTSKPAL